jgi:hypothetical protein
VLVIWADIFTLGPPWRGLIQVPVCIVSQPDTVGGTWPFAA